MNKLIDLTGEVFGRLTVVERAERSKSRTMWKCICSCGNEVIVAGGSLKSGGTKSCGCLRRENSDNRKIDLKGQVFGFLQVIEQAECTPGSRVTRWRCKCGRCGNDSITVSSYWLRNSSPYGHCECTKYDKAFSPLKYGENNHSYKHGQSRSRLYRIWCAMHNRTTNTKQWNYQYYGARGITICDDWMVFDNFCKWATENGYNDTLSIDRINPDGNYEPANCRWIPLREQLQSAVTNGHWCGGKRPQCGASAASLS